MEKITEMKALQRKATEMRISVIKMLDKAGSGHIGGALGIADIMTYLYFNALKHNPARPDWEERDYFLMSNGHVAPIWYAVLAHTGYFSVSDLDQLRKLGSHLQGHPLNTATPGVFNSSGPLGHGEAQAVGVALGLKLDKKENRVYCLMSDGEQQEGAVWEAALNAAKFKLDNLTFILDSNNIQIDGNILDIMPLPNLKSHYEGIGFSVAEIDGNEMEEIAAAVTETNTRSGKPHLILANTIPGKGVSFMERKFQFHDWKGEAGQTDQALSELESQLNSKS